MMYRSLVFAMLAAALAVSGCAQNEESFYIEHVKVQPDAPECTVSTGDNFAPSFTINLFSVSDPSAWYLVANNLISQEVKGSLKSESNGVLIDGYELYTFIPGQGAIGGTEYFEYNQYLAPESTDVVYASLMSPSTIEVLRNAYNCNPRTPGEIANILMSGNQAQLNSLRNELTSNSNPLPDVMYSVVRFRGHTQGGKDVETQEFRVKLNTYCGMDGGWNACLDNPCFALCEPNAVRDPVCSVGVNDILACQDYLEASWYVEVEQLSEETGQMETVSVEYCKEFCGSTGG